MKSFTWLALSLVLGLLCLPGAKAGIIIDSTTPGFYNSGLGDLANDSVLGAQTDLATGLHLFPAPNVSAGDPLIPPIASQPDLSGADLATQTALGGFLSNVVPLGGAWSLGPVAVPGTWSVNSETAIVYQIDAGAGLQNVLVSLGVDNGVFVWLNGTYKFGALAPGGASPGEYSLSLGNLTGINYLQILREDHGGATGWDITVSADSVVTPEPSSFAMLGGALLALAGLAVNARRRS